MATNAEAIAGALADAGVEHVFGLPGGQITGRPGVCMATVGPGAVNLGLGVSNALLDRSPVLALTADLSTTLTPHFPHQRLALGRLFGAIAKASAAVDGRGTGDLV